MHSSHSANKTETISCVGTNGCTQFLTDTHGQQGVPSFNFCTIESPTTDEAAQCFPKPALKDTEFQLTEIFSRNPKQVQQKLVDFRRETARLHGILEHEVAIPRLDDALTYGLKNATAHVLRRMKLIAEDNLNQEVHRFVVAVPAYYGEAQKVHIFM
jgi:hypothetical protein